MVDAEANDVLCNEETEPVESLLSKLPEPEQQPEQQPEPEQPKPKAKAKPKGRPPPKAGETTPLRPRLREKQPAQTVTNKYQITLCITHIVEFVKEKLNLV